MNISRASITSRGFDLIVPTVAGGFYSRIYGTILFIYLFIHSLFQKSGTTKAFWQWKPPPKNL